MQIFIELGCQDIRGNLDRSANPVVQIPGGIIECLQLGMGPSLIQGSSKAGKILPKLLEGLDIEGLAVPAQEIALGLDCKPSG